MNISITAEPEIPLTVSLYDVQGTRIHTQALSSTGADNISIDAATLGSGIYQLIIQSPTEMKSQTVGVVR
ncbi:MAG: T9SS type A sorting domain-containing protein [Candidatus Kapaibacterium sp.]